MSTETQSRQQAPSEAAGTPVTVLFVDDEPNILRALRRVFRRDGYRILMAESGAEGLEILAAEQVDLVISDMRMPVMDGAAFLKQVAEGWPDAMRLLLTGYADLESAVAAINDGKIYRYLSKPWDDADLRLNVSSALQFQRSERERRRLEVLTRRQNDELKNLNATLEDKVATRTQELRTILSQLGKAHDELKEGYVQAIQVFARMIDMRTGIRGGTRQVAIQAHQLALDMGLPEADAQDVLFAALLRDLGKIGFSDELLHKSEARMDPEELDRYRRYPIDGQAALMSLEALQGAARIIRAHREHVDGSGFPDGLSGADIPMGARILAVVGDFHALRDGRITRVSMKETGAYTHIERHRGRCYDAEVADAYRARFGGDVDTVMEEPDFNVSLTELAGGMVLSRDILSSDGMVWLPRGQMLDERLVSRIREISDAGAQPLQVYVYFRRVS